MRISARSGNTVNSSKFSSRRFGIKSKLLMAAAPVVAGLGFSPAWGITTLTWDGLGSSNNWSDPNNWSPVSSPASGDILAFNGSIRPSPFNNLGSLNIAGITFDTTVGVPFTITGNAVTLSSTATLTDDTAAFSNTISLGLALTNTVGVNVATNGTFSLAGVISGVGDGLSESGSGALILGANNTFTGPVTISDGAMLNISADLNLGAAPGSFQAADLVLDDATLTTTANMTLNANRGISIFDSSGAATATVNVPTGVSVTYNGVVSNGASTVGGLTKLSFGTLVLGGANTYTGATTIGNGTVIENFAATGAPASNIISSQSALTLAGSTAGLGDTSYTQLIITGKASTTSSQTFSSTTLAKGPSLVVLTPGTSGTATLALNNITPQIGGYVDFIAPGASTITTTTANTNGILGAWAVTGPTAGTTNITRSNVIQGTSYAAVNNSGQIVAYTGSTDYNVSGATNSSTGDTGPVLTSGNLAGQVTSATNLKINFNSASTGIAVDADGANSTTYVNTIAMTNTAANDTIYIGQGNTLVFGPQGGFFKQDPGADPTIYLGGMSANAPNQQTGNGNTGTQDVGTITAGGPVSGTPGVLTFDLDSDSETTGTFLVEPLITDNGPGGTVTVVKTGAGSMKLDGHNTFSGGLYIEQGRLQFAGAEINAASPNPDGGGTGPIVVFPGAQWFPSGAGSTTVPETVTNPIFLAGIGQNGDDTGSIRATQGLTLGGTITLFGNTRIGGGAPTGGAGTGYFVNPSTGAIQAGFLISGQVTGPFSLDIGATGNAGGNGTSVWLGNSADNYTGNTTIMGRTSTNVGSSTLFTAAPNVIPNGIGNGNLVFGISGDTDTGAALTLDLDGNNQTVNGLVTTSGVTIPQFIQNDSYYFLSAVDQNSNTYSAPAGVTTAPSAATLTVGNNNQSGLFSGVIRDNNGQGTTITGTVVNGTATITYAYAATGDTIAVTKIGTGLQTLSGANTYSGPTNINNGAVSVTGSLLSTGNVFVNTSATSAGSLYGTGQVGTVTLAANNGSNIATINPGASGAGSTGTLTVAGLTADGGNLAFDLTSPGNSDVLTVQGTLSLVNTLDISPTGGGVTGTYTVVNAGLITGGAGLLDLIAPTGTRDKVAFDPSSYPNSNNIIIDVTGGPNNLLWNGKGDGTSWDVTTTKNWFNQTSSVQDYFYNFDNVTFDDTATPDFNITVSNVNTPLGATQGGVVPSTVTFNNNVNTYTFSGFGEIEGSPLVNINGSGGVVLLTTNTLGMVNLNAGTLKVGNGGTTGALDGTGTIQFSNTGLATLVLNNSNSNTLAMNVSGSGTIIVAGTGSTYLSGNSNFNGAVFVQTGTLLPVNSTSLGNNPNVTVTIANGATLDISTDPTANDLNFGGVAFDIAGNGSGSGVIVNNGVAQQNAFQSITLTANASIGGSARMDLRNNNPVLNLNGFTLAKNSTGQFSIVGGTLNGPGTLVVNTGLLSIETSSISTANATVQYMDGSEGQFYDDSSGGLLNQIIVGNGSNTQTLGVQLGNGDNGTTSTVNSPITVEDALTIATINSGGTGNIILAGNISDNGTPWGVTVANSGTLTPTAVFTGTNTYSGVTTIGGGATPAELQIGNDGSTGSLGTGAVVDGGTLAFNRSDTALVTPNNISGTGTLLIASGTTSSIVTFSGSNSYSGGTILQQGGMAITNDAAIGYNTSNIQWNGGTLLFANYNSTLTFINSPTLGATPGTPSSLVNNALQQGATLTYDGPGSLILNGSNSYTGGTNLNAGTLAISEDAALGSNNNVNFNGGTLQFQNYNSTLSLSNGNVSLGAATGAPSTLSGDLPNNSLAFNGPGTLILTGSNTYNGATTVNAGTLVIGKAQSLPTLSVVSIGTATQNGILQLGHGIGATTLASVTVDTGSSLDITNNPLFINYGFNSSADPIAQIVSYLSSGYSAAGGHWTGGQIDSSSVASANTRQSALVYSIGYADSADGLIPTIPSGEIEVLPTLAGDAKLQGNVVFGDFQVLAQYFGKSNTTWDEGDFTYSGTTNFGDFQLLAQNFGSNSGGLTGGELASINSFAAGFGAALVPDSDGVGFQVVSVPEPASLGLMAVAGMGLLARRKRRQTAN
jgi:fibronectin-binding autotransporter adhesin